MDARILPLLAPFVASGLVACTPDKDGTEDPVEVVDTGDPDSDPTVDSDSTGDSDAPTDSDSSADTGCTPAEDLWGDRVVGSPDELLAVCGEMCEGVTLHGMLWVSGEAFDDLSSLSCLSGIDGDLIIDGPTALTDLHGLQNLRVVTGAVELENMPALSDLSALSALEEVGTALALWSLPEVTDLGALGSVTALGLREGIYGMGGLTIARCDGLRTLEGLSGLSADLSPPGGYKVSMLENAQLTGLEGLEWMVGGELAVTGSPELSALDGTGAAWLESLWLSNLPALSSLHGLPAAIIQRVELTDELGIDDLAMDPATAQVGQLWMSGVAVSSMAGMAGVQVAELDARDMPALRSLEGPDWPATMDSVIVAQAPELEDLSGLEGVTTLRYGLALMDNTALRALDGLDGLEQVDEWVQITDNTALPTDEIEAFLARITVGGTTTVSGNGP